jgi:hypothetical protein
MRSVPGDGYLTGHLLDSGRDLWVLLYVGQVVLPGAIALTDMNYRIRLRLSVQFKFPRANPDRNNTKLVAVSIGVVT